MKAIGMQPVCTACHGAAIARGVAAALDDLYQEDRARGLEVGDIPGALSIVQPAPLTGAVRTSATRRSTPCPPW